MNFVIKQAVPEVVIETRLIKAQNSMLSRLSSVAVLAEIPLRSQRKLLIFIIKKCIYRMKVSKNKFNQF